MKKKSIKSKMDKKSNWALVHLALILVFLSGLLTNTLNAQTPVAANGKLKVVGTQLVNETGDPVQLRGFSSHGLSWYTEDYNYNSIRVMANEWGVDILRLAVYPTEKPDQTKGGYEGNPEFWKNYVDNLVDMCEEFGIYCIIDWHVLTPGDPTDATYFPMAKEFWNYMSQKHAGQKNVLYEICNEPNGISWSTVKSYAETIIPIIRANDPNTVIIVGSPTWSSDVDIAANDPITDQSNIMYTFHFYAGSHGQSYRDKITTALSKGLAVFVTEWGTTNADGGGSVNTTESTTWLNFMNDNKLSWCNWSYSDKNETSAALVPYSISDDIWDNTSTSGQFVLNAIQTPADSWAGNANWKPVADISAPLNNAYYKAGTSIAISAKADDADGTVSSVAFYVDGSKIGTDNSAPYSVSWTPTTAKDYVLTTVVTDNSAATSTSLAKTVHIVNTINESAYPDGTPTPIPGTIQSYNFDNGGEMIGYHDLDAVHKGPAGSLRADEGVDVEGSADIGYTIGGEWLAYTVDIATTGNYDYTVNCASGYPVTGKFHLELDGAPVTDVTDVPSSGSWGSYQPVTVSGVQLTEGVHVLRFVFDVGYFNITSMKFEAVTTPPTVTLTAPTSNLSVKQGTPVTISADASDSDGSISKVEFYAGGGVVATDITAPYSVIWTPQLAGTYEVSAKAYDNMLSTATSSSKTVTVTSDLPAPTTPNLALNKTATASSIESDSYPAANAVDGNTSSRWSSEFADPQWLKIDLQSAKTFNRVILRWEAAYATTYNIQVSNDGSSWTSVASIVGGNGDVDDITFSDVTARYVRMYGTARVTEYGYSLYEFEVYASEGTGTPVTGITVAPTTLSLNVGDASTITPTVLPTNATNKNVTWVSSNTNVATVNSSGDVTGIAEGTATITATTVDGSFTATTDVTVSTIHVTGVSVSPATVDVNKGTTATLTATITPSNAANKSVTWSSSDATIATVSSTGVVTGVADGTATITATTVDGGYTATSEVNVTTVIIPVTGVTLSPATVTMNVGTTADLTATVLPVNASDKSVSYASGDETIATVSNTGVVTAIAKGVATITVTTGDGNYTASSDITVSDIILPCANPVAIALPLKQNGEGEYCWTTTGTISYVNSWNMDLVEINGEDFTNVWGSNMPAKIDGKYFIHYKSSVGWAHLEVNGTGGDSTVVGVTGVSVDQDAISIDKGATATIVATVAPSNATDKSVSWSTSDATIATVSGGVVTGVSAGTATITVSTTDGGYTATTEVTVVSTVTHVKGVSLAPTEVSLEPGATASLTSTVTPSDATDKSVSYSTSDATVATVNSSGVVTGVAEGTATITVTTTDGGYTATSAVTVTPGIIHVDGVTVAPTSVSVDQGATVTLTATVTPSDATDKSVSYSTSDETVATVNSSGVVTGVAEGTATITVTTNDMAYTATAEITVNPVTPVCDNPVTISLPFSKDGAGEFCYVTSDAIAYVNSWNLDLLEINGVDFTNTWSGNMPAAIDGKWYIHYVGPYGWSHFEAASLKDAKDITRNNQKTEVKLYPNPFSSSFKLVVSSIENIQSIKIYNQIGKAVLSMNSFNSNVIELGDELSEGVYIVQVQTTTDVISYQVIKENN